MFGVAPYSGIFWWIMASNPVFRASLWSALFILTGILLPGTTHGETIPSGASSGSIANQLTTTIPLKQCQYPRFWSHGDSAFQEVAHSDQVTLPDLSRTARAIREAPSSLATREAPPFVLAAESDHTTALFNLIRDYYVERGYKVPESLVIVESRTPNAFVRRGREVVLTSSMARHVTEPSELAFVLAHEVAHVALGHQVQGGISSEVAADALALAVVSALGFNPCSGTRVLERLGSPSQLTLVSVNPRLHALHDQTSSFCG